jgi:hypothetical protein
MKITMIADWLSSAVGALLGTLCISTIFIKIFQRFFDMKLAIFIAFIGSSILILCITSFTMGFVKGFITYIPFLFLWCVIDLYKVNKTTKDKKQNEAPLQ